ncbi:TetR/AcrR family transcriptional regulator [Arthrobacter sp. FW306-05-C]|uniref:TetR/AcrR family transcriptional regulator n=1 Tax=Arthrobacter TaxID=1663 RepID=UPI001EF142AE|nr:MULTISPECIES: TetR/AcrR family transcriptional regulator [Arthrobacter]MDP9986392.1 AcrR family transcriptional regulator [Arthrobacter oryzae]UKA65845.1 TetR/AcrR family transcriptional regulator [Arthrobacter sp. FW306-05-C]UKA70207.1 TetR/AcrR family transcriptional regulator [Arthrobacter sp. FW306-06-A]UKA74508.1 TetR/AcrR family transcriptional regulator [Arthrobacter sp. FW306-07-I]
MSEVNAPARRYHSPRRKQQAAATRDAVLAAARELFVGEGYRSTTVAGIARRAGVAVDTVYAAIGRKPDLLREVVETAISGTGHAVPAESRDYVIRLREAERAADKISIYAHALAAIQPRLAPVYVALRDAAGTDADCAALWREISDRRAANMLKFVEDLAATGELRTDRPAAELADAVWSMNGPEYWVLLVDQRGWTPEQFAGWLTDAWCRLLLTVDQAKKR